jgi:hypothetical protein
MISVPLPKSLPPALNCHTDDLKNWRVALLISLIFDVIRTRHIICNFRPLTTRAVKYDLEITGTRTDVQHIYMVCSSYIFR